MKKGTAVVGGILLFLGLGIFIEQMESQLPISATRNPALNQVIQQQVQTAVADSTKHRVNSNTYDESQLTVRLMATRRYLVATSQPIFDQFKTGKLTIRYQITRKLLGEESQKGTYLKKGDGMTDGTGSMLLAKTSGYYKLYHRMTEQTVHSDVLGHPRGAAADEWVRIAADPVTMQIGKEPYLEKVAQ
ncbi:MAG: hypothetical protein ABF743_01245 [Schleiferilactobacillus perolens]|uniref:hypothetical protein n=1 Tax=Schleiferilactobacillus perolens TaxID=100468 RepID=UPI0039EB88CD